MSYILNCHKIYICKKIIELQDFILFLKPTSINVVHILNTLFKLLSAVISLINEFMPVVTLSIYVGKAFYANDFMS